MTKRTRAELLLILELDSTATPEDIKKRYYKLVKKYHPDSTKDGATPDEEEFSLISEAFSELEKLGNQPDEPIPEITGWISVDTQDCYTGQVLTINWNFEGATRVTFLNTGAELPMQGKTILQIPYHTPPHLTLSILAENPGVSLPATAEVTVSVLKIGPYLLRQLKPLGPVLVRFLLGLLLGFLVYQFL